MDGEIKALLELYDYIKLVNELRDKIAELQEQIDIRDEKIEELLKVASDGK